MSVSKVLCLAFAGCTSVAFAADPILQGDNRAINNNCASDAGIAHCDGEKVGSGLIKCLQSYERTHRNFVLSSECRSAIRQRNQDKKPRY
ncbi:exported hypothetical protein [Gammaproteobacteria bacterium]